MPSSDSDSDSDSNSTSEHNPNPNPNPISKSLEKQLESLALLEGPVQDDLASSEQLEPLEGGRREGKEVGEVVIGSGSENGNLREEWKGSNSEAERVASPSSSGYAGERGSSSGSVTSGLRGIGDDDDDDDDDEIRELGNEDSGGGLLGPNGLWVPGKRHLDEDDASLSWRKRKKHFFILSNSGKPIYSRYGDEHRLAGFSATLQAIISFVENGGDHVKLVRAGKHQVVFLVKGPIYLVCISCTEEPYESLRGQLELIYGQMIVILTKSVNRCFDKNPKFDMTPLLGGTDVVFSSLIHSFSWNPATFLHAYTCLPLAYATRQAAGAILQDVADSDCRIRIESVLLKSNVLSEVQRSILDGGMRVEDLPDDPLPRSGAVSPLLGQQKQPTDSPERCRQSFVGMGGPAGLWHFIYRSIFLDQYVSSEFSPPINTPQQQKKLYRAYQKIFASMHDKGNGPHKTQFRRDENYVLLCWVTPDFELYAVFDPLADKALAIKTCNRVVQWVKDVENEIFLLGASPFSW